MMVALDGISLLLLAAATWRLSALISYEKGPWNIFVHLRALVGILPDPEDGTPAIWAPTFVTGVLTCVWCLSLWIAAVLVVGYVAWPPILWLLLPFSLSAGAILLERLARR